MKFSIESIVAESTETSRTGDQRLDAVLDLPLDERAAEVALSLIRQFLSRIATNQAALIAAAEAAFPRTDRSVSSKSILCSLLQLSEDATRNEPLLEATLAPLLQGSRPLGADADTAARADAFYSLPLEEQRRELAVGLIRQHLHVAAKRPPSDAATSAFYQSAHFGTTTLEQLYTNVKDQFDASFPKVHHKSVTKMNLLVHLAQVDTPPATTSVLEALLGQQLSQSEILESVPTQHFEYTDDDAVEINGIRVSDVQQGATVNNLDELDLEHAVILGKGAGGSVMKAVHRPTNYTFAVKEIRLSEESIAQVQSEVQVIWGSVKAPVQQRCAALVDCYGVFYRAITLYIVMELMEGSLKDLIKKRRAVDEQGCLAIAYQVLQGLHFLHSTRRQLHRDIKPHNILFRAADGAVKIADFGISSKQMESVNFNKQSTYCGTTLYMSPQRIRGEAYGVEGDLWSFGVTLLELARGDLPFTGDIFSIDRLAKEPPTLPSVSPFGATYSFEFQEFLGLCFAPAEKGVTAASLLEHNWLFGMTWDDSRRIVRSF